MADQYWVGLGALVTLAASEVPDPSSFAAYGPWALAFVLLLVVFKEVVMKALGMNQVPSQPKSQERETEVLRSLAVAVDKLALVLDRMERTQEKGQEEILSLLRRVGERLQDIDHRTKEILKHEERQSLGGAHGGAET